MINDENYILTQNVWPVIDDDNLTGGKAKNLFRLTKNGINVPPWIVVTINAYNSFTENIREMIYAIIRTINFNDNKSIAEGSQKIRSLIETNALSERLKEILVKGINEFIDVEKYYAVRSSAVGEDSSSNSFAGQMDTYLFVKGIDTIIDAVKKCWASAFTDRAIAYRHSAGIGNDHVKMGVIIQEMIFGDISGVTFTLNPISKKINEMLINSTYGIGEGIVSGELNTDQFRVDKNDMRVTAVETVNKDTKVVFNSITGIGTMMIDVDPKLRETASLDNNTVLDISKIFKAIEKLYSFPQDIEWTIAENKLYILQTRPITTINKTEYLEEISIETIWDNSNIVESYSGVTSPLTFSFVRHVYYMVYLQFCQVLRVPKKIIVEQDNNLKNMVGCLNGNVYYNLKNWFRLVSNLPGYNYNKKFMEQMMGVKESTSFSAVEEKKISGLRKYFIELPKLFMAGLSLFIQFLSIKSKTAVFMKRVTVYYEKYRRFQFDSVSSHELFNIYMELEKEILMHWKAPIINDFLIMIVYGIMKNLIIAWKLDDKGNLQNDLLCGQGDVESTMPMKTLLSISEDIKKSDALMKLFLNFSEDELIERFLDKNKYHNQEEAEIGKRLLDYLDEYGFRNMNELKLEVPSLKENPRFIFLMLKNYLKSSGSKNSGDEVEIRTAAEKMVKKKLRFRFTRILISKNFIFNRVVSFARKGVKFREYQRFARTKMFGLVREIFNSIGKKFYDLDLIDNPHDIFYLTRDEIFSFIEGTSICLNLRGIIDIRKKEYEVYYDQELNQRLITRGIVYREPFMQESEKSDEVIYSGDENILTGVSCCPGIVRGKVKVIQSPGDDMSLNGEILVAGKTDPGWIPLYPSASGLLIERGSVLSHSAIVAREMGLPAIVGITGILKALKTGDEVELDGSKGIVRIINRVEEKITV